MVFQKRDGQHQIALWNATAQAYPQDKCVPQLVATWAATTPQAVALAMGTQVICYDELNQQANRVAHYLQKQGVGPNVRVAVCIERSFEMVIALLGVLKAGGAYVALDPGYPAERLAFLIADAQAPVVVTQQHLSKRLPLSNMHSLCIDANGSILERQDTTDPACSAALSDLIYIVYTSGSTGLPKGVQIQHKSLLNLIFWHQRAFQITPADRATQLMSPSFDVLAYELWPYLTAGASVYLVDESARVDPLVLYETIVKNGITMSCMSTLLAESLITFAWPATTRLRYLLAGGDTLHRYPPAGLPFQFVNNYGPAEATVQVTSGIVPPVEHPTQPPTIGRTIANTQIYILDEQLRQVPVGEPGELHIGGVGLAVGYLNRPQLTAEKFIANPFSCEPGARLYKTGDLARYLADGQIAFLGRIDHQIKIRGYRIEPGEVISALNKQPAIQTSFVLAREDTPGDKRLVAYIVLKDGAQVQFSELREALSEFLPDYMIPPVFVRLDALPITPNGKVDRAALPAPDIQNMLQDAVVIQPRTPVEKCLAEIIASLLGKEQIGIDDNFFLLGGHSMLGAQVIVRITELFGITLPLSALFEAPTVQKLAVLVEQVLLEKITAMSDDEARLLLG